MLKYMNILQKVHEKSQKVHVNYQKRLKNFFSTYFGYNESVYHYWSSIREDLVYKITKTMIETVSNGLIMFLGVYWIWSFYRIISQRIFFGWFEIPLQIISLGIFSIIVRKGYKFFKEDWKK